MDVSKYLDEGIPTQQRRSTLARLQNSLADVSTRVGSIRKALLASVVLTAAFSGAVFGLVLSANEISKETKTNSSGLLVDRHTNEPIIVEAVKAPFSMTLKEMTFDDLKTLHHIDWSDVEGTRHYTEVHGFQWFPQDESFDATIVLFDTNEGAMYLNKESGDLDFLGDAEDEDTTVEDEEFENVSGRSLLEQQCKKRRIRGKWIYRPRNCNNQSQSIGLGGEQCLNCSDPVGEGDATASSSYGDSGIRDEAGRGTHGRD